MDLYRPVIPYLSLMWPVKPKELPTPEPCLHKQGSVQQLCVTALLCGVKSLSTFLLTVFYLT
jgi:hypothetical protein